tara:strand:- start:301 stop:543 length:243 start_codon:yes stop_codon:yes gene_type:complete
MEQHWTETPSGQKLSSLLQSQLTQENFDKYSLAHRNSLASAMVGLAKTKTPEEITPAVVKGAIQMEEQMHGVAVHWPGVF